MKEDEKDKKNVRKVGLKQLTKEVVGFEPDIAPAKRERMKFPDAYYATLDASRDFLVWCKRYGAFRKERPKNLGSMLLELEKLAKKMNMVAIENSFDYSVNYNECYFDMMTVENVALKLNYSLNTFMKSEKALSVAGQKVTPENKNYTARIKKLAGIASLMVKSSRMFMDQLEREFDLEPPAIEKRRSLKPNSGD